MKKPPWRFRQATRRDGKLLAGFACADRTVPWQREVEDHVQQKLLTWALDKAAQAYDPRLLLLFDRASGELVALAAHERQTMRAPDQTQFAVTKLEVVAVASAWQGKRFASGERVSDVVMSVALADVAARVPPRDARVFAVTHQDNVRSIALCQRHGLVHDLSRSHPDYRRLVTEHH